MIVTANPISLFERFLMDAIALTYYHVSEQHSFIPRLSVICDHLPQHFNQELGLFVMTSEHYGAVGAENQAHFFDLLNQGAYDCYIPDRGITQYYLNQMCFSYLEDVFFYHSNDTLRNAAVVEVW